LLLKFENGGNRVELDN